MIYQTSFAHLSLDLGSREESENYILAEKLRTGTLGPPVHKDAKRFTALRERARAYAMVTRDVARVTRSAFVVVAEAWFGTGEHSRYELTPPHRSNLWI